MDRDESVRRGDVWIATLPYAEHCNRPVVVISTDYLNRVCPRVECVPFTSRDYTQNYLCAVCVPSSENNGLSVDSVAQCDRVQTVEKSNLSFRVGEMDEAHMEQIIKAVAQGFGLREADNENACVR